MFTQKSENSGIAGTWTGMRKSDFYRDTYSDGPGIGKAGDSSS